MKLLGRTPDQEKGAVPRNVPRRVGRRAKKTVTGTFPIVRATRPFLPATRPHTAWRERERDRETISSLLCSCSSQIEPRAMARYREAAPPGVNKPGPWGGGNDSELDVFGAERYFNGDNALWCARSSSSFSSAFRTGTTHERVRSLATATAATSSSEASWNSRSALLPDGKALAAADIAAPSVVEAEPRGTGSDDRLREKPLPPSQLRRWLLGVAGCACIGGGGDGEESENADELWPEEGEDGEVLQRTRQRLESKELASVRVRPGRWLDDGEDFLAGKAQFFPVQAQLAVAVDDRFRAANSAEFSAPVIKPATTTADLFLQPVGGVDSALVPTKQDYAAFTIVAGNTARGGCLHAVGCPAPPRSPCDTSEEDAAPSELGRAYPPSEASVVWSVVTADGAASCNFSSAASGHHYRFNGGNEYGTLRQTDARSNRTRRRGVSGGLLTCMGDKAVNAIGPVAGARTALGR